MYKSKHTHMHNLTQCIGTHYLIIGILVFNVLLLQMYKLSTYCNYPFNWFIKACIFLTIFECMNRKTQLQQSTSPYNPLSPYNPFSIWIVQAFGNHAKLHYRSAEVHNAYKSHKGSTDSLTAEFHTFTAINISTKMLCREIHGNGIPWPSNCIQATHHQAQYQVANKVV